MINSDWATVWANIQRPQANLVQDSREEQSSRRYRLGRLQPGGPTSENAAACCQSERVVKWLRYTPTY